MKLSICAPCHNRTYDLKQALPTWIASANNSPPVEILVLNYNSPDDLDEYMEKMKSIPLAEGNTLIHLKYAGRDYYHMAHARNLSILSTTGEYFAQISADSLLSLDFVSTIRSIFSEQPDLGWITIRRNEGIMIMKKQDFIDAGGYDERFEFYSPEDKDLTTRLLRRGLTRKTISIKYVGNIFTPKEVKGKNYRLKGLSQRDMGKLMSPIYFENIEKGVLVANEGKEWGQWI